MEIQENISLAPFTTFGLGGPAKLFCRVSNLEELKKAITWAGKNKVPIFILGGGSNILVSDTGFDGLVIKAEIKGVKKPDHNGSVLAMAGENWHEFVNFTVENNLQGVECLSGIPGTVGAAPIQNINAYGQHVENVIEDVNVMNLKTGEIKSLAKDQCKFGYRTSIFKKVAKGKYAVVSVVFRLKKNGKPELNYPSLKERFRDMNPSLKEVADTVVEIRARKGMVILSGYNKLKSAGSFFVNPVVSKKKLKEIEPFAQKCGKADKNCCQAPWYWEQEKGRVKVSAACLLHIAGFEPGTIYGNSGISPLHALAIINHGGATAEEIKKFAEEIKNKIKNKFRITLECEPEFVNF